MSPNFSAVVALINNMVALYFLQILLFNLVFCKLTLFQKVALVKIEALLQ